MLPDTVIPGSFDDWFQNANSDLILAGIDPPEGVRLESFCFHAQQAAEKALKALLLSRNLTFPKTHDIRALLALVPETIEIPDQVQEAILLTDYAVTSRYPGNYESVSQEDYHQALTLAKNMVDWVSSLLRSE